MPSTVIKPLQMPEITTESLIEEGTRNFYRRPELTIPLVSQKPETDKYYGDYVNLAAADRKDRRLIRKALRNGLTGQYMDAKGNIVNLDENTTRTNMRKAGRDIRAMQVAGSYGFTPQFTGDDADYKRDIWKGMVENPNATYIQYVKNPEDATLNTGTQTNPTVTSASEPGSKYKIKFEYDRQDGKTLNYDKVNEFWQNLIDNYIKSGGTNYFKGLDLNNDNIIDYNELLKFFENNWTTGYNLGNGAQAWDPSLFTGDNEANTDLWTIIENNARTAKLLAPLNKNGGTMEINKYLYGGTADKAQEFKKQLKELVAAAKNGVKEARQKIAQIKEGAKTDARMKALSDAIDQELAMSEQQTQYAKMGAKLAYIQRLRNKCPEGFELQIFKSGGQVCTKCMKKAALEKNGGKSGDESDIVKSFKEKCGGKMKKK